MLPLSQGFARFASRPYSLSESSLTDLLVHLTNTEVQKQRDHVPAFFLRQSEGDTSRHQPPENSQRGESSGDGGRGEDAIEDRNFDIAGRLGRAKVNGVDGCQRSNGDGATLAVNTETAVPIIREDRSHPVKSSSLDSKVSCASDSNSSRRSEAAHAFESEVQAENSGGFENLYGGCKVSLIRAFALMVSHGVNVDRLWRRITALVLQSLEAVQTAIPANKNCFELFGYDVLVDETHQPWLVEVNSSPSMETGTPLDCALKGALIRDTLALVRHVGAAPLLGGRDLI